MALYHELGIYSFRPGKMGGVHGTVQELPWRRGKAGKGDCIE
jgi:hypothetical protein